MNYVPAKDLSNDFKVTVQTIYNHLNKHKSIRRKKERGKTVIHQEDFKAVFQKHLNPFESSFKEDFKGWKNKDFKVLKDNFKALENEQTTLLQQNHYLSKQNTNLQDQANKLAIYLNQEKEEKKEIIAKSDKQQEEASARNDELQVELRATIERFSKERVKRAMKYYLAIGIGFVFLLLSIIFALPLIKALFE